MMYVLLCRRFFDLEHWKVVLVDQRGCGASKPTGCLVDNTTQALINDYEKLRKQLKIKKWMLFGGSWGVALSLAYAQQHATKSAFFSDAPLCCLPYCFVPSIRLDLCVISRRRCLCIALCKQLMSPLTRVLQSM